MKFIKTTLSNFYCRRSFSTSHFTHLNNGRVNMVDIAKNEKPTTYRVASASGKVFVGSDVIQALKSSNLITSKGPLLTTAEIAGIMGAKKTYDLIPLCHNINLTNVKVSCTIDEISQAIIVKSDAACIGTTGVEMEALTAVSIASLTLYDMCKSITKSTTIQDIKLDYKSGGKNGNYSRSNTTPS